MRLSDKLLVYFEDELPLMARMGAATLACWPELTPHAQRRLMECADQILDDTDDDASVAHRLKNVVAAHSAAPGSDSPSDRSSGSAASWLARVVDAVRSALAMDLAFVSRFEDRHRVICAVSSSVSQPPLTPGQRIPLSSGYCKKIVDGALPAIIPDTGRSSLAARIAATHALPIGSHVGIALKPPDGRVFGTLCCLSHKPRPDLNERHLAAVRSLAELIV